MALDKNGNYVNDAPSWWLNKKSASIPSSFQNALLPFMSPEDMRMNAGSLSKRTEYGAYRDAPVPPTPTSTAGLRNNYFSAQRASSALTALDNMRIKTGKTEAGLGSGYRYLTDVIKTLQRLGGTQGGMSRANYQEFQNAINALSQQAQDDPATRPYAAMANAFVSPGFSAGGLMNVRQSGSKTIFGNQNKQLFT